MIFKPTRLGASSLSDTVLIKDKKSCIKFGPCGAGEKAIYLNSFYFDRRYYVPFTSIKRIYKRIAMSKGGFTGKGMFATIPYLVVVFEDGKEKQCIFKAEEDVDHLLDYIKKLRPGIKLHSEQAEKRLLEKEKKRKAKTAAPLSEKASGSIRILEDCTSYLDKHSDLCLEMSASAKMKRSYERRKPAYSWAALFITLLGIGTLIYGIYALITHAGFGIYFLLFGLTAVFFFSGSSVLPTSRKQKRHIEERFEGAMDSLQSLARDYPAFPLPAHYAHPVVCRRMINIILDGRTETIGEALEILKEDLQAVNSGVSVEQEEYDEITAIKPIFLIMNYE
ncbi:ATPase P [Muricomes intestini]|jgi:hypothetical protein|uniref:ATPase P n=1 Tax=Muricomes intestini TaxID=1796634 RepID=A0A4R3K2W8_9FIRM|nr:ATPase P [Muricomes intestini]TCS77014.1 hypothetical protein EDD59_12110 [Muricomes intestini]HAX53256.1 ATPase P [Lachnospiraceae bacterium]HCR81993.1 ATPase P [Lachnospiraceae bacterium]